MITSRVLFTPKCQCSFVGEETPDVLDAQEEMEEHELVCLLPEVRVRAHARSELASREAGR